MRYDRDIVTNKNRCLSDEEVNEAEVDLDECDEYRNNMKR